MTLPEICDSRAPGADTLLRRRGCRCIAEVPRERRSCLEARPHEFLQAAGERIPAELIVAAAGVSQPRETESFRTIIPFDDRHRPADSASRSWRSSATARLAAVPGATGANWTPGSTTCRSSATTAADVIR